MCASVCMFQHCLSMCTYGWNGTECIDWIHFDAFNVKSRDTKSYTLLKP